MTRRHLVPALLAAILIFTGASPLPAQQTAPQIAPATTPGGSDTTTTADPREGLKAGLFDAGETSLGLDHIDFLKKPDAFTAPPPKPTDGPFAKILASLVFANSDFAFEGNTLFQGNFSGVGIYDISDPAQTKMITTLVCPGGQGDVSVYGHLLFMSVEMPNGRIDCGTQGVIPMPKPGQPHMAHPAADPDRFRGVRIFDVTDLKNPKQVAAVQTCRGSHTHTLVVDPNDKDNVYVYVSGTSYVRGSDELAGCSDDAPDKDPNTALFSIDVIKVPLASPQDAKIVSSPRVFIDPRTGALNGLNNGGSHDKGAEKPADTNQCHDITVFSAIGMAAGACSGNGILLNIKDPVHPVRIDAVNDVNYSYWHSATFSNDGTKVVFTDEWGGGLAPRCRSTDPKNWGADAVFNLQDGKLKFASYYKMPAAQTATENCVAHNGSLIPVPGRDVEVQAWYQGGVSIMDFTDAAKPFEIGYYDRGPIDAKTMVLGGQWSAYWYNGFIYGSEIARGLDVFKLTPTPNLTQNEIDAAKLVHFDTLNVQDQPQFTWPSSLIVAKAYLDQLARSQALPAKQIADLNKAIDKTEKSHLKKKDVAKLGAMASTVDSTASGAKTSADAKRLQALAEILRHPVA
ncbi:MAG TPA: hypothetical protein VK819_15030 [Acidobacteriaceae bacterium]|nr:hypothetical protein [Acidobacteriaceae bacterium]